MREARFFPDARLNFAENLLRRARRRRRRSSSAARTRSSARLSWDELRALVSRLQQAMRAAGRRRRRPRRGDAAEPAGDDRRRCSPPPRSARSGRPARPISASAACSTASARSSRSCFIACDGYWYAGKAIEVADKLAGDRRAAAERGEGRRSCPISGAPRRSRRACRAARRSTRFIARLRAKRRSHFERLPFDHPLYILFSSGTTGVPKCIVHGAGGTLLQHLKEHRLHCSLRRRRAALLLHHLRLDDVELARHRRSPAARRCSSMTARPSIPDGNVLFDYARGGAA